MRYNLFTKDLYEILLDYGVDYGVDLRNGKLYLLIKLN